MRRNVVLFVLVPFVLAAIVVVLFIDGWVESGLEYAGERIVNARVEIDDLDLSLFPIGIEWSRLRVANPRDPWKNIFETGVVAFSMDAGQLIRAKFIVETIRVESFVLGTRRTTDGSLPVEPVAVEPGEPGSLSLLLDDAKDALVANAQQAPVFDVDRLRRELNLDSLTNPANLETYRLVDSLRGQLQAAEQHWNIALSEVEQTRKRVVDIEQRVRSIDVNQIKTLGAAQTALKNASEAYEGTRQVFQTLDERKRALTKSVNMFSADLNAIDDAARRDFNRVLSLANLPDVSMKGLAELVLGGEILAQAYEYLGYAELARSAIPPSDATPESDQPNRSKGVTIHFPEENAYPKFWIKEVVLSGGTDSLQDQNFFYATGSIRNITNDQRRTRKPLTADIDARNGKGTRAVFKALFDRRTELSHDRYDVSVSNIVVGNLSLGSSDFLPSRIGGAAATAVVAVDLPGSDLESSVRLDFRNLRVAFDRDPRSAVERLTRDVLASIAGFFVDLRVWKNDIGRLDIAFATDLDDQLSGRARQVIGAEVARIRADIERRVYAQVEQKRREIEALYTTKKQEVQQKFDAAEREIRQKIAVVEQKRSDLENRVAEEKKRGEDAVKKKAGDVLKGIFKKN